MKAFFISLTTEMAHTRSYSVIPRMRVTRVHTRTRSNTLRNSVQAIWIGLAHGERRMLSARAHTACGTGTWKTLSGSNHPRDTATAVANNTSLKISDFTGQFAHQFNAISNVSKVPEGTKMAKLRMQEIESENPLHRGTGAVRGLSAGHRFTLKGGQPGDYVVTGGQHTGNAESSLYVR